MPIKTPEIDNIKKALQFYERALYLGDTEIAKKIGFIYLNDETLQDVPKAIEMYGKAVENGEKSGLKAIKAISAEINKKKK